MRHCLGDNQCTTSGSAHGRLTVRATVQGMERLFCWSCQPRGKVHVVRPAGLRRKVAANILFPWRSHLSGSRLRLGQ